MKIQTRTTAGGGSVAAPHPPRSDAPLAVLVPSDPAILVRPLVRRDAGRRA